MLQRISPKEGQTLTPESSLTWCLAHLCEPGSPGRAEHQTVPSKDTDKRSKMHQWRALVAIRTQHIKGDKAGIARFRGKGGVKVLLNLLKHPECSRKVLDLALSILANCCTELETRLEVRKLEGINIVGECRTVQNRAARALGNLAMDPESSALIHSAGGVPLLLLCVSSAPSSPTVAPPSDSSPKLECAQSAARALLYLSDSPSNRLSLLTQGTLSALAPLIAPEYPPGLRRAALRTLHELTKGCGVECAREVSRSGVLSQLGVMATGESGEHFEELALKTLANVCSQGCLRPLVGSLGVIQRFTEEVKKDPLRSGVFLKALCLCCKEAVNRAKVKENGGLEVLMTFLSSHQNHPLSRFAILACVDFVFDESAMEQLQELGLVPVLVARLAKLARGEEHAAERADANAASNMAHNELLPSSCLESWLLSEGLISSEGELPPSVPRSGAYHHPYHPEPWTPESPILLLLSRFSHASDPSAALVSSAVISDLLCYLTQHQDPSSRCFRMLCRLSCNPSCLQALVRTGSVALIRHLGLHELNVFTLPAASLGDALLNNLRVQCESGFGSGVLTHVMLSGSESDRMNCALSLPFITSNKSLLKKLLLDCGGLLAALKPLDCAFDDDEEEEESDSDVTSQPQYFPLLFGCLSALSGSVKPKPVEKNPTLTPTGASPPSDFDLVLELDDATRFPANQEAVAGAGSEYFRALLRGGFGEEAQCEADEAIRIKDVSAGMLLPPLHYLHGCRFGSDPETGGECEAMVGASRFLVLDLQRELEEVFLSFLESWSDRPSRSNKTHIVKSEPDQKSSDPTSELEVTAPTKKLNGLPEKVEEKDASFTGLIVLLLAVQVGVFEAAQIINNNDQ
uniref:Armadillo repeat containing 5 n=1 Tax=Poecilia latipinna TaxID=48699 RepID=A0A3B3W1A9_9TELE